MCEPRETILTRFAIMSYQWFESAEPVALRKRRRDEAKHTFIVIGSYYKHAEVDFTYVYGDDELRQYLVQQLTAYYKERGGGDLPLKPLTVEEMNAMDLMTLCARASVEAKYRIENEIGSGIRAIVRCQGLPETIVDEKTTNADAQLLPFGEPPVKRPRLDPDELDDFDETGSDTDESPATDSPEPPPVRSPVRDPQGGAPWSGAAP